MAYAAVNGLRQRLYSSLSIRQGRLANDKATQGIEAESPTAKRVRPKTEKANQTSNQNQQFSVKHESSVQG
ncbi:MAG: hypothetical protein LBJ86_05230 [Spirochaetaceae bacterium]|nr:hypothetical protein [Spirochaetaceae bacterium]